jgi:hypothetical protein
LIRHIAPTDARVEYDRMPLLRYFVYVGGALLALLFIVNACLPALPVAQTSQQAADLSVIRIHSNQKWPEQVVFDTSRPTVTPAPAMAAVIPEAPLSQKTAAAQPSKTPVRDAFAQMRNPNDPHSLPSKPKRKSVAKNYAAPPNYAVQPRMLVAQQPPVAFFGRNVW